MAVLPDADRIQVWADYMRRSGLFPGDSSKGNLMDVVNYTDSFIDSIQSNYNSGLPNPFKISASEAQKTVVFCLVAMRRAGLLKVEGD